MPEHNNLPVTCRNSVQAWHIDGMGHMNVQFYMHYAMQALSGFWAHIGVGKAWQNEHKIYPVIRQSHIRFLREQHVGAPFYIRTGIAEIGEAELRLYCEMRNTQSNIVCAAFSFWVGARNEDYATRLAVPDIWCEKGKEYLCTIPPHGDLLGMTLTPPRPAPYMHEADALDLFETYMGEVSPQNCDINGYLTVPAFMGIVSDSIPNLLSYTRNEDRSVNPDIGGAALEYRFVYHDFPQSGDILQLRSGICDIQNKTYSWGHWLFNIETGKAVATSMSVAIALDLRARKAIIIPDDLRANLTPLLKNIDI